MKHHLAWIAAALLLLPPTLAVESVRLTDVIRSSGVGTVDLFKDVNASTLEALRIDNNGQIVLAVDVNEASSGTEKASTQAVTLKTVSLRVTFDDGSQEVYGSWFTETQALVAENPGTTRQLFYTLPGETGSNRVTANNFVQNEFDSTLKIRVTNPLVSSSREAVAAVVNIRLLETNTSLGDPEAFYDYSNGFEDLALINAVDKAFLDSYEAGISEAPAVITNGSSPSPSPQSVKTWNYFPSATSFYMVGYEDQYPQVGDYDFNDLTVAYQLRYGLNSNDQAIEVRGVAYLLTRGAAYTHDWRLTVSLPATASGSLSCTTFFDKDVPGNREWCSADNPSLISGSTVITVFGNTAHALPGPSGSDFANTLPSQVFVSGPKSEFTIDLDTPIAPTDLGHAAFDPTLFVHNTGRLVKLLQLHPSYTDSNGNPFGMLMPGNWQPPLELVPMSRAYLRFQEFVATSGSSSADWYNTVTPGEIVALPSKSVWAW